MSDRGTTTTLAPSSVAVLVPVLRRPHRVAPVLDSLLTSVENEEHHVDVVFVCSPSDHRQTQAILAEGELEPLIAGWPAARADYARKINHAAALSDAEWLFTGADDLRFHEGWLSAALAVHDRTGALVVGTNDIGNATVVAGRHATHSLVHRSYLQHAVVDAPGHLLSEAYDHNCNPGDAPIWMGDMTFRNLEDVEVGDEVIGWQREAAGLHTLNRLAKASVLSKMTRTSPLVKVTMASGRELRCTPDHLWLNAAWSPGASHPMEWVEPRVGRTLLHVVDVPTPVSDQHERLAGWVAGIYDGEGSGVYIATQSYRENPDVHAAIGAALATLEIPHTTPDHTDADVGMFCLTGGRQGYLNFLLRIQPVKRQRLAAIIYAGNVRSRNGQTNGGLGASRFGHRDPVVSVEPDGDGEVYSMMTSTGNYVAWGYASKNCCDVELVETAIRNRVWAFAKDSVVEHEHWMWRKATRDPTYRKGLREFKEDRRLLEQRRRLWARAKVA